LTQEGWRVFDTLKAWLLDKKQCDTVASKIKVDDYVFDLIGCRVFKHHKVGKRPVFEGHVLKVDLGKVLSPDSALGEIQAWKHPIKEIQRFTLLPTFTFTVLYCYYCYLEDHLDNHRRQEFKDNNIGILRLCRERNEFLVDEELVPESSWEEYGGHQFGPSNSDIGSPGVFAQAIRANPILDRLYAGKDRDTLWEKVCRIKCS